MHPSQYELAGWIQHHPIAVRASQCSPHLRPIVRSFAANIARIESAWLLLPYLVDTTVNSTAVSLEALHNVLETFDSSDPRQDVPEHKEAIKQEFFRLSMRDAVRYADENDLERALGRLDSILSNAVNPYVARGVETTLASQILYAWTAVESLTKDLWVAAINYGPKRWASKVLKSKPLKSLKEQEKSISISTLQLYQYDIRFRMGTILKEKINFETADEVLDAYVSVFGEAAKTSFPEDALLHVQALEAIRNLIAHRGGIIDLKFQSKIKKLFNQELHVGRPYYVTGKLAGMLTHGGIEFGMGLVNLVENSLNGCDPDGWYPEI